MIPTGQQFPVAIFIFFAAYGCASAMGDGAARVRGSILDERGNAHHDCRLDLINPTTGEIIDYQKISEPSFTVTFIISPVPDFYKLRVGCATSDEIFIRDKVYLGELKITYQIPFDIGAIALKRR